MAKLKHRYANALLEISEESGNLEKDLEQAIFLRDMIKSSDIEAFLVHPHVSDKDKRRLFDSAFSNKISKTLISFLYLMVQKNRESFIVPALTEYIDGANRKLGKIEARVVSAKELTEKQIERIHTILSKHAGAQIKLETVVDPDVIGGFYVLTDGRIFDGTVKSKLNSMKECLKRGNLNGSQSQ